MPSKRQLNELCDILDELYPSTFTLQKAKRSDENIGLLVTLTTRVKIYHGCFNLIEIYKKTGSVPHEDLARVLNRIRLHRFQLKKMNQKNYIENHKYLVGLAALLYVSFAN